MQRKVLHAGFLSAKRRQKLNRWPTVRKVLRRRVKVVRVLEVGELPLVGETRVCRRIRMRWRALWPLDVQASMLEVVGRVRDSCWHVEVEGGGCWSGGWVFQFDQVRWQGEVCRENQQLQIVDLRQQLVAFFNHFDFRFAKTNNFGLERLDVVLGPLAVSADYRISQTKISHKRNGHTRTTQDDQRF